MPKQEVIADPLYSPSFLRFILLMRTVGFGTIDMIGVKDGDPDLVIGDVRQKIDLSNSAEIESLLTRDIMDVPFHNSEKSLSLLMKKMGKGTITQIVVKDGLPVHVVINLRERVNLEDEGNFTGFIKNLF